MWTSNWLALGLFALALPAAAAGTVYRWVDARGQVHYSDNNPQAGAQALNARGNGGASAEAPEAPAGSTPAVATPAAGLGSNVTARLTPDAAACEQKKKDLAGYRASTKIAQRDLFGNIHEFTAEERQKLLEVTQGEIDQLCAQ